MDWQWVGKFWLLVLPTVHCLEGMLCAFAGSDHFNGYRVYTLVDEILQRIIHKPMACHAGFASEQRGADTHPEMAPESRAIGAGMACMGGTFVQHFEVAGLQHIL